MICGHGLNLLGYFSLAGFGEHGVENKGFQEADHCFFICVTISFSRKTTVYALTLEHNFFKTKENVLP